jgi:bifunctional lysine-specific demethylase and histidyl-hydroxylase NO66
MTDGAALRRCTGRSAGEFAEQYWSRQPLLTRDGRGYDDLFSATAVDELVSRRGLRTPFLRMAKDGTVLAARQFTRAGGAGAGITDQAADDRVLAQLADGATLVLQGLHRTWPPLVDFGTSLAAELGHPVQINAYVTPPDNRGFAPHYDVHDVFVLQVAGTKRWRIHAPVVCDPLESQNWERSRAAVAAQAEHEPMLDCVLVPGDALYLPRGTIHAAEALGETSVHLTVGIHPITRYQLVRELLDLAQENAALRTALPVGVDLADPATLGPHLAATIDSLHAFLDDVEVAALARRVGDRLAAQTRPAPIGPLAQLAAADALAATSRLQVRPALRCRLDEDAGQANLVLPDRTVTLPRSASAALKTVLAGEPFTVAELPGLDADDQLLVARRLLCEGVIVPG